MQFLQPLHDVSQRNAGLDLFRSIALFMVFFAHSLHLFLQVFPPVAHLSHLMRNGVELFFSLSGFLIGNIIARSFSGEGDNKQALFRFYRRRWFKTLPLYYLGIAINLLAGVLITGAHYDFNWKFLFFLQNLHETEFHFFPISYSLAIEEWFYLLFPVLLLVCIKLFRRDVVQTVLLLSLCYIIAGILLRYALYDDPLTHWDSNVRKTLSGRVDASVYGILVSVLFNRYRKIFDHYRWHLFAAGIALQAIAIYVYLFSYQGIFNYVWYFTFIPLGFALLIPVFYSLSLHNARLVRVITWLSLVSFAFYIVHLSPVMEIIVMYFKTDNWLSVTEAFLLFTFISFGLAHLLNTYIEKPILEFGTGRGFGKRNDNRP